MITLKSPVEPVPAVGELHTISQLPLHTIILVFHHTNMDHPLVFHHMDMVGVAPHMDILLSSGSHHSGVQIYNHLHIQMTNFTYASALEIYLFAMDAKINLINKQNHHMIFV